MARRMGHSMLSFTVVPARATTSLGSNTVCARICPACRSIYAPVRAKDWTRSAEIEYAEKVGAPIGQSREKIWSIDENLWGRSIEGGHLEDPFFEPPEEIFTWTSPKSFAPDHPESVEIHFQRGLPIAINGVEMPLDSLIQEANNLAGKHGVGRIDIMEDRLIGLKVRENYECPGATLLIGAHKELESFVCTPQERRFKASVDTEWAQLVYAGLWGDPLFEALKAFTMSVQARVNGTVRIKLFKGSLSVNGRQSSWALYNEADASFDDSTFSQSAMEGMVQTHGMSSLLYEKIRARQPQ
jgi:argininosuccinate synthase